jgi:hypothetical protein
MGRHLPRRLARGTTILTGPKTLSSRARAGSRARPRGSGPKRPARRLDPNAPERCANPMVARGNPAQPTAVTVCCAVEHLPATIT